jgi:hypothetical protein
MNSSKPMMATVPNSALYIGLQEAAGYEGVLYPAFKRACARKKILLRDDPADGRRKQVPVTALSKRGYENWLKEQAASACTPSSMVSAETNEIAVTKQPENKFQPFLPFRPQTETERELAAAIPPAIPKHLFPFVRDWSAIFSQCLNGAHKVNMGLVLGGVPIRGRKDLVRAVGNQFGVSPATIYEKLKIVHQVQRDPSVPRERKWSAIWEAMVPKPRPGRSGHSFFDDCANDWAAMWLQNLFLNQSKIPVSRAHELLCEEIDRRQRAWGPGHRYQKPTPRQCRTFLSKLDLATRTLGREGEKAYNDRRAPYMSRRPPKHANDVWVTDQRLCNVRVRDGGNRLGRVWVVNFLDVSSWKWLGCMFAPVLTSDLVMAAAAQALEQGGVPRAIHMDLGKEFIGKRFLGGTFRIRGEALYRDAIGLWERVSTRVIKAIGRNPQSKIIERWHRELDRFDQEMPGWCGSNTDERPETLEVEEAEHKAWLEGRRESTPLLRIEEYIDHYLDFCGRRWNAEHRGTGKYLQGMTPNEAWNTRLPEGGIRRLTREEIAYHTADHHFLQVARGGQVNVNLHGQRIEYEAPELFALQGEEVEVVMSRTSLRSVRVIFKVPGGNASCVAKAKPLHG